MADSMSRDKAARIKERLEEGLEILRSLDLPRAQQNERSVLTLLALLAVRPDNEWDDATAPLMGITPIMDFARNHYGREYAPNTRETFRRQTMHQFVDAGIVVMNPDKLDRAINSPKSCYQIEPSALELLRLYGTPQWTGALARFMGNRESLAARYARTRQMQMIPALLPSGEEIVLTAGAHSELIRDIIQGFAARFAPGAQVLYVGDTGAKTVVFETEAFRELGLEFDAHGKFPDVVLYDGEKRWLLLVESVTSHGPVDPKRHVELERLFHEGKAGLIFVTAFPDKATMARYVSEISWETEVWVAETPSHLIHFDGKRFLGPYQ